MEYNEGVAGEPMEKRVDNMYSLLHCQRLLNAMNVPTKKITLQ